jgi:rod shape-determining protein MreC
MSYPQTDRRGRARTDFFTLVGLVAAGALVAGLPQGQQATIAAVVRNTVLYPFLEVHRTFAERARLRERFADLRAERDSLAQLVVAGRQLAEQGTQLRQFLQMNPLAVGRFVPADLFSGQPRIGDSDVFILRGAEVGSVRPPVGVFTGRGLVGVVRGAEASGALGEFWSHPDFRVSVEATGTGITGIVSPLQDESGQPGMLLQGAPYQEEIPTGTPLVTTGLSGLYPPGIRVGTVREIESAESGWMKRYIVEPAVRPEDADVVLLWIRPAGPAVGAARPGLDPLDRQIAPDGDTIPDDLATPDSASTPPVTRAEGGAH